MTIGGQEYTPEELVAMVLTHAKDITTAFGVQGDVKDCVLTVPSFYTQHERRALLDAASLADLNVLALIDETTAAGLHYGIDRIEEVPQNIVFYNMGASALQVSIIQFYSYERKETKYAKGKKVGAFQVLGKAWDAALGGAAFDARIVNFMADEFNEIWDKKRGDGETKDVRSFPRAMAKLHIQANKVKHVLSANNDFPIFIDALHDEINYQSHMSRAHFEELCHDLFERSSDPITRALKAANMTLDDIHAVELIGGGMRVPKIREAMQVVLGEKLDLGMHINSDESMALGAAFHGANISTAFKVRHVGMTDINPFPISVSLDELTGDKKKDDEDAWSKHATIFKANGKVGVKKTIAFSYDHDIACAVDYDDDSEFIPAGTLPSIEKYNITGVAEFAKEMADKGLATPKVSLQFELSTSGLVQLVKAEAVVEETYTVMEDVEVDDEDAVEEEVVKTEETKDAETTEEKAEDASEATEEKAEEKTEDASEEKTEDASEPTEEKAEEKTEDASETITTEEKADKKTEKPKKKKKKTISVEKVRSSALLTDSSLQI